MVGSAGYFFIQLLAVTLLKKFLENYCGGCPCYEEPTTDIDIIISITQLI